MKLEKQNILVISNEPWGDVWYSKHNYAYELSKKNKVIFVNPVGKWKIKNLFSNKIATEEYSESLIVLNYQNYIPALNFLLFRLNNFFVSILLKSFFDEKGIRDFIFWSFDPYRLYNPKRIGAITSIFHSVDKYNFKHSGEMLLSLNVNFIFCSSYSFIASYKKINPSVYILPHGISSEEFAVDEKELQQLDIHFKHYGLYIGNIDERIDYELLEKVLTKFTDTHFVFVGKLLFNSENKLAKKIFIQNVYSNLHAIGTRQFKKLKLYIANSSFCLALMNKIYPGNKIAHHKILQYLALGKPVFGCEFSEYEKIRNLLYMNDNDDKLIEQLDSFLKNKEDTMLGQKRIEYARKYLFEENIKTVEKIISNK